MDNSALIWRLIARSLNGELSEKEQQELSDILHQDATLLQQYDLLSRIWKEKHGHPDFQDNAAAKQIISRIINKAEQGKNPVELPVSGRLNAKRRKTWLVAASVLILGASAWFGINSSMRSSDPEQRSEAIEARKGSRSRSLLPDGTTVWLNAGSKITYDGDFTGATREVRLDGEAFFDVVKQPDRPFIVHTSGIDIKVLGTAFNVKSYPEDKTVETTLYRGSVNVFREEETERKAIRLAPNEKLILLKRTAIDAENLSKDKAETSSAINIGPTNYTIAKIDSTKLESERFETAWIYSRLEFRGDSFEELARKLERWYNVTIVFNDEKVKQLSFNGSFEKENVEQAFTALKFALPFEYLIKGHDIYVGSVSN